MELHNLYRDQIRNSESGETSRTRRDMRNTYKILFGKTEEPQQT